MRSLVYSVLIGLSLTSCLVEVPYGPDLGECAVYPDGRYTWGEAEIGTCLAGPVDAKWFTQGDKTFLAISNADPYRHYTSGSVVVVDMSKIDLSKIRNSMHTLDAVSMPLEPYLGDLALSEDERTLWVTSRYTPDSVLKSGLDKMFELDVSDLSGQNPITLSGQVQLRDDAQLIATDHNRGRLYVGNLTDHSVSVVNQSPLKTIDVAPRFTNTDPLLTDADASQSRAEIEAILTETPQDVPNDGWTFEFVEASYRLWLPGEQGLYRMSSGGQNWVASAIGAELQPIVPEADITDPMVILSEGNPVVFYSERGDVFSAVSAGAAANWERNAIPALSGTPNTWYELIGAPSFAPIDISPAIFFDGRYDQLGATASIGVAIAEDGVNFTPITQPLFDPLTYGYLSLEDPFVRLDGSSNRYRMWMSILQADGTWTIGESQSDNGLDWTAPTPILGLDHLEVASPTVTYVAGRYVMYGSMILNGEWWFFESWSYDGLTWFDAEAFEKSELPFNFRKPQRAGLQVTEDNSWRITGDDLGTIDNRLYVGNDVVTEVAGFFTSVSHGFEIGVSSIPQSEGGIVPDSTALLGTSELVFVTATAGDNRKRVHVVRETALGWQPLALNILKGNDFGNRTGVSNATVISDGLDYVMFYAAYDLDGTSRIRRATSTDSVHWVPDPKPVLPTQEWDSEQQIPRSVERLIDGSVRIWYSGSDGGPSKIGSAIATDGLLGGFTPEAGATHPWRFSTGLPGSFDDSGVTDPVVLTDPLGVSHLYYSGFDGALWHIGHAVLLTGNVWQRRLDNEEILSIPSMSGQALNFNAQGVSSLAASFIYEEGPRFLYAGLDGNINRIGRARASWASADVVYAENHFPTAGDTITFRTTRGGDGLSVIELEQTQEEFQVNGWGMSSITHDEDRGFLYITTKLTNQLFVVDVRDDTNETFIDRNVDDLEAVMRMITGTPGTGFRDSIIVSDRSLLYLTQRNPDGIAVVNLDKIIDNESKELIDLAVEAVLPLPDLGNDAGAKSYATIGGAGMALSADNRYLYVTHFRGNGVMVFDLTMGPYGEAIKWISNVGENPHRIRLSPDGKYAAVLNYGGEVISDGSHGTVTLIDTDPSSDTFLKPLTWLTTQ